MSAQVTKSLNEALANAIVFYHKLHHFHWSVKGPQFYQLHEKFEELYDRWAGTLEPVLRQVHEPGQKLFVDWAGQTVPIHQADGTVSQASLFVAVLGASNKIYVEAFPNQQLEHWITGHCRAFAFYEGVTRAVVPDNPKTAVTQPCRYEPVLHRSYQEMAQHYGTVILPTKPRPPGRSAAVTTARSAWARRL